MTLHGIQVGTARASLRFRRDGAGHTEVEVLEGGGLAISRLASLPKGRDRIAAALQAAVAPSGAVRLQVLSGRSLRTAWHVSPRRSGAAATRADPLQIPAPEDR